MNYLIKYFAVILSGVLLLFLSGCTLSPQELREAQSGKQVTFIAPEGYQSAYHKILTQVNNCYNSFSLLRSRDWKVYGELFDDTKSATIAVVGVTGGRNFTEAVIDISAIDKQQTKVEIYSSPRTGVYADKLDNEGQQIKRWYFSQSKECD